MGSLSCALPSCQKTLIYIPHRCQFHPRLRSDLECDRKGAGLYAPAVDAVGVRLLFHNARNLLYIDPIFLGCIARRGLCVEPVNRNIRCVWNMGCLGLG